MRLFECVMVIVVVVILSRSSTHCNEEFYHLSRRSYYVDKSDLLREFFRQELTWSRERRPHSAWECYYYYITCPRDFGKTTNLKMIRSFAQIELDSDHRAKPINESYSYRAFKRLKIGSATHCDVFKYHLGQYAVIYLDLEFAEKELVSDAAARDALVRRIQRCYKEYEWMLGNATELEGVAMKKVIEGNVTREEIIRSLLDLNLLLRRYFGRQGVILLVDNFDSAASNAVFAKGLRINELYAVVHEMLYKVINTRDTRVRFLMMTGITSLYFKSPTLDRLANIQHYPFLENTRFSKYFGFEQQEVMELMNKHNCTKEEQFSVWYTYKGHNIAHHCLTFVFNPYSIVRFVLSKKLAKTGFRAANPYWAKKEQVYYIKEFLRAPLFRRKILELVRKGVFIFESPIKEHNPGMFQSFLEQPNRDFAKLHADDVPELFAFIFERGLLRHTPAMYTYEWASKEIRNEITKKLKYREIGVLKS